MCRWAFCDSLANPNKPVRAAHAPESNLEMSWDVFAGEFGESLLAALAIRAAKDGIQTTKAEMAIYFRSHLERGILQLQSADGLSELCKRALQASSKD